MCYNCYFRYSVNSVNNSQQGQQCQQHIARRYPHLWWYFFPIEVDQLRRQLKNHSKNASLNAADANLHFFPVRYLKTLIKTHSGFSSFKRKRDFVSFLFTQGIWRQIYMQRCDYASIKSGDLKWRFKLNQEKISQTNQCDICIWLGRNKMKRKDRLDVSQVRKVAY